MRQAICILLLFFASGCQGTSAPRNAQTGTPPPEPQAPLTKAQRADLKIALARSLEKGGDADQAMALYSEAVAADPKRVDAYLRLAALHDLQGHTKEAREYFGKAMTLQPKNADVYCNLGYSLYLQGDLAKAAQHLQHALQLNADHARAHNNLGLVLARMDQSDQALAEFKKAGCSTADAHINLAYCCLLEGRPTASRQHLDTALKLEPNSAPAKKALQDLEAVLARNPLSQPTLTFSPDQPASPAAQSAEGVTSVTWGQSQ